MRSRRPLVVLAAATIVSVASLAGAAPSADVAVGTLGLDDALFWNGGHVGAALTHSTPFLALPVTDRCAQLDPCFAYTFEVAEPGARLRVALDTPARDDGFELNVYAPGGTLAATRQNNNAYSMEVFVPTPAPGAWRITVAPYSADHATFRMRAKLESAIPSLPPGEALPNLRVLRMWEFGFAAPANPGNGLFPPDDVNPPLSAAGLEPVSCSVDEQLGLDNPDHPAQRCLRYSFGLGNAGPGNFDIRYTSDRANNEFTGTEVPMTQCVQQGDGSPPVAEPAGSGWYHATHGHFHYNDIIYHDVWRVNDTQTWARTQVGAGKKIGYSPADQAIVDWGAFLSAPSGTSGSAGNCSPADGSRLGMSIGWGDAYRYQRPGNFVEFGTAGDGLYVVHTIADPEDLVREANEDDNVAYAFIRVIGTEVNVLESGIGEGPWDQDKVLFDR